MMNDMFGISWLAPFQGFCVRGKSTQGDALCYCSSPFRAKNYLVHKETSPRKGGNNSIGITN